MMEGGGGGGGSPIYNTNRRKYQNILLRKVVNYPILSISC